MSHYFCRHFFSSVWIILLSLDYRRTGDVFINIIIPLHTHLMFINFPLFDALTMSCEARKSYMHLREKYYVENWIDMNEINVINAYVGLLLTIYRDIHHDAHFYSI